MAKQMEEKKRHAEELMLEMERIKLEQLEQTILSPIDEKEKDCLQKHI